MRHVPGRLVALVLLALGVLALSRAPDRLPSAAAQQPTTAAFLPSIQREPNTPTPTIAPSATPAPTATPTEIANLPAFKNPGFEQGHTGWVEIPGNTIIQQFSGVTPHAGQWLADLGGEQDSRDEVQQVITLPHAQPLYARYFRQVAIDSGDLGVNEFIVSVNETRIKSDTLLFMDSGGQWEVDSVDLSAYAGQTITLRFRVYMDNICDVYLDDISLSSNP